MNSAVFILGSTIAEEINCTQHETAARNTSRNTPAVARTTVEIQWSVSVSERRCERIEQNVGDERVFDNKNVG